MKRYSLYVLGLVLIALFAVSCSSTPPAADIVPEPEQEPDKAAAPVFPAPEAELQKAEALKKTIDDYDLSFALPDEFRKANEELSAGKDSIGTDNAGAKTLLDSAAGRYTVVFDAAIDQGSKARLLEIQTAKTRADSLKAARAAADSYKTGEEKTDEGKRLLTEGQYVEAWTASGEAIDAFNRSYETARAKRAAAEGEMNKTVSAQTSANARLEEVSKEIGGEEE
jgi:hypothetical protein